MKIFTDRGKQGFRQLRSNTPGSGIGGVNCRTIKPDGTIVDLNKDSIFERELAKTSYEAKCTSNVGSIEFTRRVQVKEQTVPVERYQALRKFIEMAYGAGEAPIVLMRQ